MQIILSKQEVLTSNEIINALIDDVDFIAGSDKRKISNSINEARHDFKAWVSKYNGIIIEKNDGNKIKVDWVTDEDDNEFVKITFNEQYTMNILNVYLKHADSVSTLVNCVAGLMIGLKSAFKSLNKLFNKIGNDLNKVDKNFEEAAIEQKATKSAWSKI